MERIVTLMVLLMIVAFLISWLGYAILCVLRLFDLDCPDYLVGYAVLFTKTGPWTNTVVFIFLNPEFRKAILPKCLQKLDIEVEDDDPESERTKAKADGHNSTTAMTRV